MEVATEVTAEEDGEAGGEREIPAGKQQLPVSSLVTLALGTYARYLEEECAAYVALTHIGEPLLNTVKDQLLIVLKNQINSVVVGSESSAVRRRLYDEIISGRYPSPKHRNSHVNAESRQVNSEDDDENEANNDLEKIKHFGRRCCSPCCTGAFIVEVMLSVIINEDIEVLVFPLALKQKVFKTKSIRKLLFFDIPSILVHYTLSLNVTSKTPALKMLCLEQSNLGSLDSQLVHESILKSFQETRRYYNFPWRFSSNLSRASTDFLMLTLSNLFSQPKDHFRYLSTIRLNGECLNTRVNVLGNRGGHAAIQLMSGIAYSCPALSCLDLSQVTSLAPECLVYLFYQDAFSLLHKYMYLFGFTTNASGSVFPVRSEEDIVRHDGVRYCPWCDDPATSNLVREGCEFDISQSIYVLDDRLYDYIERGSPDIPVAAKEYLVCCVKTSNLLKAFEDDVFELRRPLVEAADDVEEASSFPTRGENCKYVRKKPQNTRSKLCDTLSELLLPMDLVDSKSWCIPLFLCAAPQLKSLGDCLAFDGLKNAETLDLYRLLRPPFSLEHVSVCLEDFTIFKVKEKLLRCLKSLVSKYPHWHQFACASGPFSLGHWIENELHETVEASDLISIKQCWREQIDTIVWTCPNLRSIKLTIQPSVLYSNDKDIWQRLAQLERLCELQLYSSCWADVLGLLEVVGKKITHLSLMLNSAKSLREDDISSMEFVNTVPMLCPNLKEVFLGYIQGDIAHSLCSNPRYNIDSSYRNLTCFEATGNMTLEALQFLWRRALLLETLRVSGSIVSSSAFASPSGTLTSGVVNEVVFNKDRVAYLFALNPMQHLKVLDVPLTLASILAARTLLQNLPSDMKSVATLQVKVSIPDSLEGENFGDLVSSVLARMASFKNECLSRRGEVVWNWRREGILTILLQQQMLLSVTDLIDP